MWVCALESDDGIKSSGAGVPGNCELPGVDVGSSKRTACLVFFSIIVSYVYVSEEVGGMLDPLELTVIG